MPALRQAPNYSGPSSLRAPRPALTSLGAQAHLCIGRHRRCTFHTRAGTRWTFLCSLSETAGSEDPSDRSRRRSTSVERSPTTGFGSNAVPRKNYEPEAYIYLARTAYQHYVQSTVMHFGDAAYLGLRNTASTAILVRSQGSCCHISR